MTPRVVVVDDDLASASVIAKLLRRLGCEVTTHTDPQAALSVALQGDIDLVSLDLGMRGLDGRQLLALIRSHEHSQRAPSVPLITVTGHVTAADRADALAQGFAAHLGKPVMIDALRRALSRALMLRGDLHRTRHTADKDSIEARMREVRGQAPTEGTLQAGAGMALAAEQRGRAALQQGLRLAFVGNAKAARAPLAAFARAAEGIGAQSLRDRFEELCARLDAGDDDALETAAVLARAELDRVIFTLREQARAG
ncbi:MAG: response regulator [Rubrivivax sp.]|nr:response regulator [Rubrivivax sp.]MCL4697540.1 response regulator [Burkholderiaceae bacterium]